MADLVTPPAVRRGTKRTYRDTSALKQQAARDLQAAFDLPESPATAKVARKASKSTAGSRPAAARSLSSSSARGKTPVRQMAARTSTTTTSRARLAKAMSAAAEADLRSSQAARSLRATMPSVARRASGGGSGQRGTGVQKVENRTFLMTTVPSLQAAACVDEVGAATLKECVRAAQLARLNFASNFKAALAAAHKGASGTELLQTLQAARRAGNGDGRHKQVKVAFPASRGAFLRLFGERVADSCTAYGQFTRLSTAARAAMLVNAGVADDEDETLDEAGRDCRAEWDMAAETLVASPKLQPVVTLRSFKAQLRASLQLDYLVDKDLLLDAMLPRGSGRWTLGRFMSVGGTMDVAAELCSSDTASVAFVPNSEDAASCVASIRATFARQAAQRGGITRSTPVCRDFLKARGTVTVTLPLRYVSGPAQK